MLSRAQYSATRWLVLGIVSVAAIGLLAGGLLSQQPVAIAYSYKSAAQCRTSLDTATWAVGVRSPSNRVCGPLELFGHGTLSDRIATQKTELDVGAGQPVVYPLAVSSNGRYLVDATGAPFLMVGDSPQALIGDLTFQEADSFLADRKALGFNTVWINLVCNDYTGCNADGTTRDGIAPFSTPGSLDTPNEEYFSRADAMLSLAAKYGLLVVLDPIETGGWLPMLRANGVDAAYRFGQYVGNRYKDYPNLIWMSGNDYETWQDANDDALVLAVARGISDVDHVHIQTVELNDPVSSSRDDARWAPLIQLDASYTYSLTYAELLEEYNRSAAMPIFMVEANYESEHDFIGQSTLRRQEYWSFLSGSTGQLFGSRYTWQFIRDWQSHVDTLGSLQFSYAADLFGSLPWYELIPDQDHTVVTHGYGTFSSEGGVNDNDYATAARTPDGSTVVVYIPTARTLTIDMSKLSGPATARWFDPAAGTFSEVEGSPIPAVGEHEFQTPGANLDGDQDWVLLLDAVSTRTQ